MEAKIRTIEERLVYAEPENPWLKLYFDRADLGFHVGPSGGEA